METSRSSKTLAAPIAILGVPFDNVTTAETVELIEQMAASGRTHYLATANIDFLVQALHDTELRRILFEAHLVLCDGTPLLWASKLLGNPLPERVAGSDLVPLLIHVAAEKGYRVFFLGGTPEATSAAVNRLEAKYPDLQIAGCYSPPYMHLLEMDHDEINRRIRSAKPDFLFVSFGCPKQEKWIAMHYRSLGVPVSVGVGGTIDFLAGRLARAPRWMQRTGTEWIFRMWQEPRRLVKRYLRDIYSFGWPFLVQYWNLQARRRRGSASSAAASHSIEESWQEIDIPERLDMEVVHKNAALWEQALATHRHCFLQLSTVRFIDSTGVGLLIRLHKRARLSGKDLVLIAPSESVQRALEAMRLLDFFKIEPDFEQAKKRVELERVLQPAFVRTSEGIEPILVWQNEVTAANAPQVWEITERLLNSKGHSLQRIVIDLTQLRFIDSTGLGIMVRAKKLAKQRGLAIHFVGVKEAVRNVLRISKLEAYLLGD